MVDSIRRRLTFANVAAAAALFIALGGASYAAIQVPKDSVGAKQIEKNAVGAKEIKAKAVRSAEVADGSIACADLAAGCSAATVVRSRTETLEFTCQESQQTPSLYFKSCTASETVRAACNSGERATGGGFDVAGTVSSTTVGGPNSSVEINGSRPDPATGAPDGWSVTANAFGSNSGPNPGVAAPPNPTVTVSAMCAG